MKNDWLTPLLEDWATWFSNAETGSYPSSTAIWRILHAPGDTEFCGSLPKGVIPPASLNKINLAMNNLIQSDCGLAVTVVRSFHINGKDKTIEEFKLSQTRFYTLKSQGEACLKGFLKAA